MAQSKMVPVVIWTMPHKPLGFPPNNAQIAVPYNPEIGLVRYGGEAWWYRLAKADIYDHTVGGAPKFKNFCQIQSRVYYGEPISYGDFVVWFKALPPDSPHREHYKELYHKLYKAVLFGEKAGPPLIKLAKSTYVLLEPGEQVELIEFGVIEITHTHIQGNGPAGDPFYKTPPHDETGWSPDD